MKRLKKKEYKKQSNHSFIFYDALRQESLDIPEKSVQIFLVVMESIMKSIVTTLVT